MDERQLKSLFCSALRSGHIKNNDMIPESEIRIVEEAHFRSFDLLIAEIAKEPIDDHAHYSNLLVRTQLLERFARTNSCRIDCIKFYPVEVKSDEDTLDERLPNQIIDAILVFGMSVLVLDKNHSKKARSLGKLLPATIICYTGIDDHFEVISKFGRLVSCGAFSLQKTSLARAIGNNGTKVHSRLVAIERIMQKLAFNQIYYENLGLTDEEMEFLEMIIGVRAPSDNRKKVYELVKETSNKKITDYL
jgi:hypothetical protein